VIVVIPEAEPTGPRKALPDDKLREAYPEPIIMNALPWF
jgi:hypothetical protein